MTDLELAILLCPQAHFRTEEDKQFWVGRARIARLALEPMSFRFARVLAPIARRLRDLTATRSTDGTKEVVQMGKVRLHPLPEGASRPLASVIGAAVAGAIRDCLNQHPIHNLTRSQKGLLIGSSRKRAVNQLVCEEGETRLRLALGGRG